MGIGYEQRALVLRYAQRSNRKSLVDLLEWMNATTEENPLMLERENEEIVEAHLITKNN